VEAREQNVEIVARQELEILARRPGRKKAPKQHLINRQLGRESHQHAGQERQQMPPAARLVEKADQQQRTVLVADQAHQAAEHS